MVQVYQSEDQLQNCERSLPSRKILGPCSDPWMLADSRLATNWQAVILLTNLTATGMCSEDLLAFGDTGEVAKHSKQLTTLKKVELIEDTMKQWHYVVEAANDTAGLSGTVPTEKQNKLPERRCSPVRYLAKQLHNRPGTRNSRLWSLSGRSKHQVRRQCGCLGPANLQGQDVWWPI